MSNLARNVVLGLGILGFLSMLTGADERDKSRHRQFASSTFRDFTSRSSEHGR